MSRTSEGKLGVQRDSLDCNPLLIDPEVGKVKRPPYSLPANNFTYGRPNVCKDGGTAEALSEWKTLELPAYEREPKRLARDFVSLNKAAVGAGMVNARELYHYSAVNDFPLREKSAKRQSTRETYPPKGMTFGKATRPSTPLWDVLEHKYQRDWLDQHRQPGDQGDATQKDRPMPGHVYETKTSLLRRYCEPADPQPPWRMPRFQKKPAHLETFRSPQAKANSFENHRLDRIGRTGIFGHGVYAAAKS